MGEDARIDRLSIRSRPRGLPVMYQSWLKLLFMHWPLSPDDLRPLIPEPLEIDTFDGAAWVGITPFYLNGLRPVFVPPLPWLSNFHELNVRTYVHYHGVPGIWFFSLDADSSLAIAGARFSYHLPYRPARMGMEEKDGVISYHCHRTSPPAAEFSATWQPGGAMGRAAIGTLEFYLVERYCLYTVYDGALFRARIFHQPWELREATLRQCHSTMLQAHGLHPKAPMPILHYSEPQHVAVWPLREVRNSQ